jgi:large subunit ribosomal protein L17
MRHLDRTKRLGRSASHRRALQRTMTISLFRTFGGRGYIVTTREKAKFCRPFAERLITLAKIDSVHKRRMASARIGDKDTVTKLFSEIAPAFKDRPGGYTRIIKLSKRRIGDNATQVLFGFVPKGEAPARATPKA